MVGKSRAPAPRWFITAAGALLLAGAVTLLPGINAFERASWGGSAGSLAQAFVFIAVAVVLIIAGLTLLATGVSRHRAARRPGTDGDQHDDSSLRSED